MSNQSINRRTVHRRQVQQYLAAARQRDEQFSRPSFSAESHVTADEREGPAGMPADTPSTSSRECLAVPMSQVPRGKTDSDLNGCDPSNVTMVEPGHPVA
jgi:hypothetical protein